MDLLIWVLAMAGAGVVAFALYIAWSLYRRLRGQHMARKPFAEHAAFLEPYVRVSYPPGEGPFPAVLLFHGCGGVRAGRVPRNSLQHRCYCCGCVLL